jgi:GTP-binding protein Era
VAFRTGLVAVLGRPNVGKSTLVNRLVGEKVAIVADTPQTTRRGIRGVFTADGVQVVFTDTPGLHKPRTLLGERLNAVVADAVAGVDAVIQVVDASAGVGRGDAFVFERHVRPAGGVRFCAVNKVDLVRHHLLVPQLAAAGRLGAFDEIVPVSASEGTGVDELLRLLIDQLPEGPPLYPDDVATDQALGERVAELVREQALWRTREEVPHSIAVVIEELDREDDLTRVYATIVVERDSQKGILIGRGGEMLRGIGTAARAEIEPLVGTRVYLDLRVKVLREWQRNPKTLNRLGL